MNIKSTLTMLSSAVAMSSLLAFGAQAAQGSGTVNFTGTVINAACGIAPESVDQSIDFGQISKSHLESGGISVQKNLNIQLVNCDTSALTSKTVAVTFNGTTVTSAPTELGTAGGTGTAIIISSTSGKNVTFGTANDGAVVGNGSNTLHYSTWVKKATGGTLAEGDFSAVSNFTLAYQ